MPFPKGRARPEGAGRKPGQPNSMTKTVRAVFEDVFTKLQEDNGEENAKYSLLKWAQNNPTEFYKLAARLIPVQIFADNENVMIRVIKDRAIQDARDRDTSDGAASESSEDPEGEETVQCIEVRSEIRQDIAVRGSDH